MGGILAKIALKGLTYVNKGAVGAAKGTYKAGEKLLNKVNAPGKQLATTKTGLKSRILDNLKNNKLKSAVFAGGLATVAAPALGGIGQAIIGGEGDADTWLHMTPGATADGSVYSPEMKFYPVTGNGNYDDVSGVREYDSNTQELNASMFGYDTERVRSFCDQSCEKGCVDTTTAPSQFTDTVYTTYYRDVTDAMDQTKSLLNANAEESWVQVLIQQRYGTGGKMDISGFSDKFADVVTATQGMYESTNTAGVEGHTALRTAVKNIRANLANGYANGDSGFSWGDAAVDVGGGAALGVFGGPPGMLIGAGIGLAYTAFSSVVNDKFPEEGKQALEASWNEAAASVRTSLEANDESVQKFNTAVEALTLAEATDAAWGDPIIPTETKKPDDSIKNPPTTPAPTDPQPVTPYSPEITNPEGNDTTPNIEDPGIPEETTNPFDEWMNQPSPTSPSSDPGSSPFSSPGMSTPSSSGMPTTPSLGDTGGLGDTPQEPFSELSDAEEVPPEDVEPLSEPLEDAEETPLGADDPAAGDPNAPEGEGDPDADAEEEPVDGTEEEPPVEDGDAPAEPTDEEKRTVQLPDGRMVTFPTEQHADMMRAIIDAGTESPTTVYAAADQAGFHLPPMGQDIGEIVPSGEMKEGDIVVGPDGSGVYVGNQEVMMENGEIRPVEEVAKVEDGSQGVFRLESTDAPGADVNGPAQAVSPEATPPAPEGTSVNAAAPGMPSDAVPPAGQESGAVSVSPESGQTDGFTGENPLDALGL